MSTSDPLHSVVSALMSQDIIPEVIPEDFVPSAMFSVKYPSGREIVLGPVELARDDTLEEPEINFTPPLVSQKADEVSYTLVMTDPDAPSRADPKYGQWRHWLITGLKYPAQGSLTAIKTKPSSTPYLPPGPPAGSGLHRYIFLLFEEPAGGVVIPEDALEHSGELEQRRSWNAGKFGQTYGLKLVGANFFLVHSTP